ncbi:hypothetical protein C8J57DRAFT_585599 [Mycena rebaudengoi]|nr:hypothetical protein C8J57DRAFT_585599 [Mycena rebaudengoi]
MFSWQSQLHVFPYGTPPPPPIAHKVWILDCKSCGAFLTNRGMKAVLLLRPNVALYSSDALPVNCSAYTTNPQALRPATACPSSYPLRTLGSDDDLVETSPTRSARPPQPLHRTCECLTQTLCCHGCGGNIGYMIVIPCARCTQSISTTNRATNGHRFVFHSSSITGTERYYIANEPGVISSQSGFSGPYAFEATPRRRYIMCFIVTVQYSSLAIPWQPAHVRTISRHLLSTIKSRHATASTSPSPQATASFPFPQDSSHLSMDSPSLPHSPRPISHSDHYHAHYPHLNRTDVTVRASSAASSDSSNSSPPPLHSSKPTRHACSIRRTASPAPSPFWGCPVLASPGQTRRNTRCDGRSPSPFAEPGDPGREEKDPIRPLIRGPSATNDSSSIS